MKTQRAKLARFATRYFSMANSADNSLQERVVEDLWSWIREFVAVPNEYYGGKFAPCPYAQSALAAESVAVAAWERGDARDFVSERSAELIENPNLTTYVMALPPRFQSAFGFTDYIESRNRDLIPKNVFLNTGVAKTTTSRYPGSNGRPYFIVVANSIDAVMKGANALRRTGYYKDWPSSHFELVVVRRERLYQKYRGG